MPSLWAIEDARLRLDFHVGQSQAWESVARIVAILAGTQGGKTAFLPWWLWREITRCGRGDYLAVTATYDLFKLKFLPAMREAFEHVLRIGRYWSSERLIELSDPTTGQFWARRADDAMWGRIILRSADSKGGLESSTAQAAVLDEAGLPTYTVQTYEAVMRRLSLARGRLALATTLYDVATWLRTHIFDRWRAHDPAVEVIQFDSIANPMFSREEYERARQDLPTYRFNMQYRGRFDRPPGLIYDAFADADIIPPFALDPAWPRYLGLDFGGVHTAGVFYAAEPGTPQLYLYREYLAGGRTATQHAEKLRDGEPRVPDCVGGSKSEGQWRDEFRAGGLPVRAPAISDVEVGIQRVYGAHKRREIRVFATCTGYLDQKRSYSRVLDAAGAPTEKIDDKAAYHYLDAERYIIGWLRGSQSPGVF